MTDPTTPNNKGGLKMELALGTKFTNCKIKITMTKLPITIIMMKETIIIIDIKT